MMRPRCTRILVLLAALGQLALSAAAPPTVSSSGPLQGTPDEALWYDWGWYGLHPAQHYVSFGASPPRPFLVQHDARCASTAGPDADAHADADAETDAVDNDEYVFVGPRGIAVTTPGPIVYDERGHLVWMDTRWGQAMDVTVQAYRGRDYLTFWHGSDNGTFGEGRYYMLNSSYDVAYTVQPAPLQPGQPALKGDLHDFVLTDAGTALMTMYQKRPCNLMDGFGIERGWIVDSLFQEVDVATGRLVFAWRASDHFAVRETLAPLRHDAGRHEHTAFDFFHINSVGKTPNGDYIVSSRYMCAVLCIDGTTGAVLWQLGGRHNSFADGSGGQATNLHWQHHAVWHAAAGELTVFDNGAYDKLRSASHSRGLRLRLAGVGVGMGGDGDGDGDGDGESNRTATLVQAYVAPQPRLAPSQGSVQILAQTDTVLVGWGHVPAYTEFAADGTPLCDVHLCPLGFAALGWCKNYRTFKHRWVGRPRTPPTAAARPAEQAVYVSWNGATEVRGWQLEITTDDEAAFRTHGPPVAKDGFETRLAAPSQARRVRVAALDRHGRIMAFSPAVRAYERTAVAPMFAPPAVRTLRGELFRIAAAVALGVAGVCLLCWFVRLVVCRRAVLAARMAAAAAALTACLRWRRAHKYQALPTGRTAEEALLKEEGKSS